jgi:hypothetical protein
MLEVAVIDDPAAAEASLDPIRTKLLAALERHGLVELVEERRKGNVTERVLQATAASYVISPRVLDAVAPDPGRAPDQLSARWLLALASRLVREVGDLITGATAAKQRLATFAVDSEIRFASAADRAAFAEELSSAVKGLVAKYHDEHAPGGRRHRLIVALHPSLTRPIAESGATVTAKSEE